MTLHIELFTGEPELEFRKLGKVKVKVAAATNFSKTPTIEDVNFKLQEAASKLGATGVINIQYTRGISAMSWRALYAEGEAVVFESTDYPCPVCAEQIKKAAKKCRFCGAEL